MTPNQAISKEEVEIVRDFITRFRELGQTHAIGPSTVALGLPAIGQRERIALVLEEMEKRGQLVRVDRDFDHIIGEPRYREADPC